MCFESLHRIAATRVILSRLTIFLNGLDHTNANKIVDWHGSIETNIARTLCFALSRSDLVDLFMPQITGIYTCHQTN
jgi:hypothetical protein